MQQNQNTTIILINFLHKRYMDFTHKVIKEYMLDITNDGWDGDFIISLKLFSPSP